MNTRSRDVLTMVADAPASRGESNIYAPVDWLMRDERR